MRGLLTFEVVLRAALLVIGLIWCAQVLPRWRQDWEEFQESQNTEERMALALIWTTTALVVLLLARFVAAALLRLIAPFSH